MLRLRWHVSGNGSGRLLSKISKKACTTLGDEELCRVYHEEFFAGYTQRAAYRKTKEKLERSKKKIPRKMKKERKKR